MSLPSPDKIKSLLKRVGVSGVNKPKRTPNHPTKSHVVVAKDGNKVQTIRFGQQGVTGAGKNPKSAKDKAGRKVITLGTMHKMLILVS